MKKKVYQYKTNGEFVNSFPSQTEAADFFEKDESVIRKVVDKYPERQACGYFWAKEYKSHLFSQQPDEKIEEEKFDFKYEEKKDSASVSSENFKSSKKDKPKILKEFLKECEVDLSNWEVESYTIKSWDMSMAYRDQNLEWYTEIDREGNRDQFMEGYSKREPGGVKRINYSIAVKLKPKENKNIEKAINNIITNIPDFQFSDIKPRANSGSGNALEIASLDAHIGKIAYEYQTGYRNYDIKIASEDFMYSIDESIDMANAFNIEKIFFILGQDLLHIDNMNKKTTSGSHEMDVDKIMPAIYEAVIHTTIESIYKCRRVAPVEIVWVPGNHDHFASMALAFLLHEHFRNDKHVTVDINKEKNRITRKARLWGNLLVGWTHRIKGKENTWGNELAQAFPEMWGKSVFREWHFGDQHRKHTIKTMPEFTSGGVLCRQLTALSPIDRWHFDNLFTDAVPGGESFIWTKDKGVKTNNIAWIGQYEKHRNKLVNNK